MWIVCTFFGGDASPPRLLSPFCVSLSFPEREKVKNLLEKGEGEDATSSVFFFLRVCPLTSKRVFFISKNLSFSFFFWERPDDDFFFFLWSQDDDDEDDDSKKKRRKNENDDD